MNIGRLAIGFLFIVLSVLSLIYITEDWLRAVGINPGAVLPIRPVIAIALFFIGLYFILSIKT